MRLRGEGGWELLSLVSGEWGLKLNSSDAPHILHTA